MSDKHARYTLAAIYRSERNSGADPLRIVPSRFVVAVAAACLSASFAVSVQAQTIRPQATPTQKAPSAKSQAPKLSAAAALIACPPDSKRACDSFIELWKAGDAALRPEAGDFGLVCFRQNEDAFLLLTITGGNFDYDKVERNQEGTTLIRSWSHAVGHLVGFKDGVQNEDDTVPHQLTLFRGTWTSFATVGRYDTSRPSDAFYVATSTDNQGVSVYVDDATAEANVTYKNIKNVDVGYEFSIQRATGRFVEKHTLPNEPAARTVGRCVPLPRVK